MDTNNEAGKRILCIEAISSTGGVLSTMPHAVHAFIAISSGEADSN